MKFYFLSLLTHTDLLHCLCAKKKVVCDCCCIARLLLKKLVLSTTAQAVNSGQSATKAASILACCLAYANIIQGKGSAMSDSSPNSVTGCTLGDMLL